MKKRLLLMRIDDRVFIRDIDYKTLKPLLKLVNIEVHTTEQGKYTGCPRHYISIVSLTAFILSLSSDYIVDIITSTGD